MFLLLLAVCSSSPELEEESYKIVDNLLRCNGYSSPRDMMKTHIKGISGPSMDSSSVCRKLPYISEQISDQILKFIKNCGLPIRVIFTPGKKLRNLFCCSRPYDKPVCESKTCQICSRLVEGKDCSIVCRSRPDIRSGPVRSGIRLILTQSGPVRFYL